MYDYVSYCRYTQAVTSSAPNSLAAINFFPADVPSQPFLSHYLNLTIYYIFAFLCCCWGDKFVYLKLAIQRQAISYYGDTVMSMHLCLNMIGGIWWKAEPVYQ